LGHWRATLSGHWKPQSEILVEKSAKIAIYLRISPKGLSYEHKSTHCVPGSLGSNLKWVALAERLIRTMHVNSKMDMPSYHVVKNFPPHWHQTNLRLSRCTGQDKVGQTAMNGQMLSVVGRSCASPMDRRHARYGTSPVPRRIFVARPALRWGFFSMTIRKF